MTFEPLIHVSFWQAAVLCIMRALLLGSILGGLVALGFLIAKNKEELLPAAITTFGMTFLFSLIFLGSNIQSEHIEKNEKIVFSNVSKKYNVEQIEFGKRLSRAYEENDYPEQSDPQSVQIKVEGKTRLAVLVQNRETSEPTLLDVDSGQPMEDILR